MAGSSVKKSRSKREEVEEGESLELGVAERWLRHTSLDGADAVLRSRKYCDFDFWVFDEQGLARAHLEIKTRRISFAKYKDAMFPKRKHELARTAFELGLPPLLAVTLYACGTLTEVDLASTPSREEIVTRSDRPGEGVAHVFYTPDFGLEVIA